MLSLFSLVSVLPQPAALTCSAMILHWSLSIRRLNQPFTASIGKGVRALQQKIWQGGNSSAPEYCMVTCLGAIRHISRARDIINRAIQTTAYPETMLQYFIGYTLGIHQTSICASHLCDNTQALAHVHCACAASITPCFTVTTPNAVAQQTRQLWGLHTQTQAGLQRMDSVSALLPQHMFCTPLHRAKSDFWGNARESWRRYFTCHTTWHTAQHCCALLAGDQPRSPRSALPLATSAAWPRRLRLPTSQQWLALLEHPLLTSCLPPTAHCKSLEGPLQMTG